MKATLTLLASLVILSGFSYNAFASISPNEQHVFEGSGFAVTEDMIKTSYLDLGVFTQTQRGSTTNFVIENGFISLDDEEFLANGFEGSFLREGKFVRISGTVDDSNTNTSVSFFGRLIEESKDASVYGFTGRITNDNISYKVVYTAKLSDYINITTETDTSESTEDEILTVHIVKGASNPGLTNSYIERAGTTKLSYFSHDRISVEPGTTITIVNDDTVPHTLLSGTENYGDRYTPFTADGRINTGEILPGESINIIFEQMGFYRLYDPDYIWMDITGYVFPQTDSQLIRQGGNQVGN